nr:hypothetical protein [Tanacetum cinerariifolium]
GLEYMSLDDLYNKLKCLEIDTKGYSVPAFALANTAFFSLILGRQQDLTRSLQNASNVRKTGHFAREYRSQVSQESTNYKNYKKKEAAKKASESSALQLQENTTEPGVLGNYGFVAKKGTKSTVPADDAVPADVVPASAFISAEPTISV